MTNHEELLKRAAKAKADIKSLFFAEQIGNVTYGNLTAVIDALAAALPAWRPIEEAKTDGTRGGLAAWIVPSEAAQANGSKPHWTVGEGVWINGGLWSGILGGKPSLFQEIPPAPTAALEGGGSEI